MFGIIVLVVLANIISRSAFSRPIAGTIEIVQYGMLFCVGMVMCRSGYEERHICINILIDKYPARIREVFIALGKLFGTAVFAVVAVLFAREVPEALSSGSVTDSFRIPFEYVYVMMTICFVTGALIFLYQLCISVYRVITGKIPAQGSNTVSTGEGTVEL